MRPLHFCIGSNCVLVLVKTSATSATSEQVICGVAGMPSTPKAYLYSEYYFHCHEHTKSCFDRTICATEPDGARHVGLVRFRNVDIQIP